nr:CopD family protein [uncultured Novosphingobium sp.]
MEYIPLKAVHVVVVLIFSGGLFVQAFGIAAGQRGGAETIRLISRWDQQVTLPAMLTAWLSGAMLASSGGWFSSHWLWAKLGLVVALSGLHGIQSGRLRRLERGDPSAPGATPLIRPTAIAISVAAIALLVVTKPF